MKLSGLLHGGAPVIKKYQVNATVSDVGIPLLAGAAGEAGLDLPTITNAADMVGLNYDTATFVTAQQTDGSSAERTVAVVINPDVIIEGRISGSATSGTQLTLRDVTTASATGLVVTTGDDWSSPTLDEGAIWGFDGANLGQLRKITSVSTTVATVTVAFDQDTVVGDNFLFAPFWPFDSVAVTLTSDFTEIDGSAAVNASGAELLPIEIIANDLGSEGRLTSQVLLVPGDHFLNRLS